MMTSKIAVRMKFFAYAREIVGEKELEKELESGSTVNSLLDELIAEYPRFHDICDHVIVVVNKSASTPERELNDGDEVSILPPVSGG